jgi:hypothetical protein
MVFWNSTANRMLVEKPPTAQNWVIGDTATIEQTIPTKLPPEPLGFFESLGTPVEPTSLYFAQLHDRLTPPHLTTDVTPLVHVAAAPAPTGGFLISITNTRRRNRLKLPEAIRGPLLVVFEHLPKGVRPANIAGHTAKGEPFVLIEVDQLLPGQKVTGLIHFRKRLPAGARITMEVFAAGTFVTPGLAL